MSQNKKILLGFLTVLPVLWVAILIYITITTSNLAPLFAVIAPMHLVMSILMLVLLFIYIKHIFTSSMIPLNNKVVWTIVLASLNVLVFPIYWYLHIWKE
jgi:hypothetical protein